MTFDEKLDKLTSSISDRKLPPNSHNEYLFLDYIEFYAFFYGEELPKSEILDYLNDNEINIVNYMSPSEVSSSNKDEEDNDKEFAINYFFDCLIHRSKLLDNKYPFSVNSNEIILIDDLSVDQKSYLILLMCSMLNVFSEFESNLTSEFEEIVGCALVKLYPTSTVKSFGKDSDYTGTAQQKIRALAKDMNIKVVEELVKDVKGNQDKGLDLIVWQSFKDKIPNMNISLVQCACGKKWAEKFDEAKRYEGYFNHHLVSSMNLIFATSYALVSMDKFFQSDEVVRAGSLILDRLRIIELIDEKSINSKAGSSFRLVDEMIEYEISFG